MSARTSPPPGWVTVAAAAAALTQAGDRIDASNVSRYLARNLDIPQEKIGKYRWVDLAALKAHRNTSVFVADKRQSRDLEPDPAASVAHAMRPAPDQDEDASTPVPSALQSATVELKLIELRKKQREEAVEAGQLVPAEDLQAIVSGMMDAFTSELARQETTLTAALGREAGARIRKAHREARAAAAARLVEAANEILRPGAAANLTPDASSATSAA